MDGKIYVSGGRADEPEWTSTFTVFDPQANSWTELASMGTARAGHISAAIGGKLYVFGGETVDGHTSSVEAYDPLSNTWAQVSDLDSAGVRVLSVAIAL